ADVGARDGERREMRLASEWLDALDGAAVEEHGLERGEAAERLDAPRAEIIDAYHTKLREAGERREILDALGAEDRELLEVAQLRERVERAQIREVLARLIADAELREPWQEGDRVEV